jgi:hypothetical protein
MNQYKDIEQTGLANLETVKSYIDKSGQLELTLIRRWFTSNTSIGKLYIDGLLYCYTLEDVTREGEKVKKETAIPYGMYNVLMTVSGIAYKWKTPGNLLPLLENVPGFSGIRIHPGQKKGHTEGCILVGFTRSVDEIGRSTAAFWPLFDLLRYCHQRGYPVKIRITNHDRQIAIAFLVVGAIVALFFLCRYLFNTFLK